MDITRKEALDLFQETMEDLKEAASTGLDLSPGDPLAGRALFAIESVIDSLPTTRIDHKDA